MNRLVKFPYRIIYVAEDGHKQHVSRHSTRDIAEKRINLCNNNFIKANWPKTTTAHYALEEIQR